MSKIKFHLKELDKALVFQVLEMDEQFRSPKKEHRNDYKLKGRNFQVISSSHPSISDDSKVVFVRGYDKNGDSNITIKTFSSNMERDKHEQLILKALKAWAKNWTGWSKEENEPEILEEDVYIL